MIGLSDSIGLGERHWAVCQIGAREHYAVARALYEAGRLAALVTDAWAKPGATLGRLSRGLAGRFHEDLLDANVVAPGPEAILGEWLLRARHRGWPLIRARNRWFQRLAVKHLSTLPAEKLTVFAYSYAARGIFAYAKSRGWKTVMGQIDPGPVEERIVADLHLRSKLKADWTPAPRQYWDDWRVECDLADAVVVNSRWSREALLQEEISSEKLALIPLVFEAPAATRNFLRTYPESFTAERPLRVLFLGQINLRKGVVPLFDAIRVLQHRPMEFWFVGPVQLEVPIDLKSSSRVRWFGPVPRGKTDGFFRAADVFIFPTFSDGFGLTQLEANAWQLPIIASRNCGEVVRCSELILEAITAQEIVTKIEWCFQHPDRLRHAAIEASVLSGRDIAELSSRLRNLGDSLQTSKTL